MADEPEDELFLDTPPDDGADPEQQDEVAIVIEGDDDIAEDETPLQKKLRAEIRDRDKRIKELERGSAPQQIEVGKKPDLWDDYNGDPDQYDAALLAWSDRKSRADAAQNAQRQATQQQTEHFERSRANYRAKAATMGLQGMEEAEQAVIDALGADYVGLIIEKANRPAEIIAALGKYPRLLAQVVDEPDAVRRIMLLANMENKVTVTRKKPPAPESETIQRGSAPLSTGEDKVAKGLFDKGVKSLDMTEYHAHMRKMRRKS